MIARNRSHCWVLAAMLVAAPPLAAQTADDGTPLSAIDWLSDSVEQPAVTAVADPTIGTQATRTPDPDEDPVALSATSPDVSVQPLGGPAARNLGLIAAQTVGLDETLWAGSDAATLEALLQATPVDSLPALEGMLQTLLILQAAAPIEGSGQGAFFVARVDKLLDFGAIEMAQSMLEEARPDSGVLFRRWFDVSLLTGTEARACRAMADKPDVAPTAEARIFCLARAGDWSAAALTLNTNIALGDIEAESGDLLSRFLDPELYEGEPALAAPTRPSPLVFRMREAIGEPMTTRGLPRAFAHADLRSNIGWKAQIEAAERLTRTRALSEGVLIDLYTARVPSASGGVWERAKVVRTLGEAISERDSDDVATALERLWDESRDIGVLSHVARYFGEQINELPTDNPEIIFKTLLLSEAYEAAAIRPELAQTAPFLAAVARGEMSEARARSDKEGHVLAGFTTATADPVLTAMAADGRVGEAILRTLTLLDQGVQGDGPSMEEGLATLLALNLHDLARRTALEYLLIDSI